MLGRKREERTWDASTDGRDDFEEDARTVLIRATVAVRPLVYARREELGEQVPVGRMKLDSIGAGLQSWSQHAFDATREEANARRRGLPRRMRSESTAPPPLQ